ncbi:PREDICTED: uncharacterized protein LOC109581272 [Amphimedon queenslandica]|uniref:Uncharacterized protein n=1 Tax=Amphimedon queenslandica TaxID=400682 RepID=A0AAN0J255_AMPQE|nr:PREDICTED: uncharacterized protein LOC109581272 [Amphimedon queenslandica]|eukprot:XP_019850808.1 PREDICTED: uncharacterized protein LOC109581272 [Amphimedon queenslandica]
MAGFSLYSNSKDTEGLIISTQQGMDRCASLLKALLSPRKDQNYPPQKENDNPKTPRPRPRQLPLSVTSSSKAESRRRTCGGQSHENIVTKPVQTVSDNMRHSANKKQAHKNCKTVNTANTRKNKKQAGLFLSSSATTVKRRRKLSRPIPVAMSTPQTNHHPTDSKMKKKRMHIP